jgi:hypothetical protein
MTRDGDTIDAFRVIEFNDFSTDAAGIRPAWSANEVGLQKFSGAQLGSQQMISFKGTI